MMSKRTRRRLVAAVTSSIFLLPAQAPADATIPRPDFELAEPMVRDQLESARKAHDALLASGSKDPFVLAQSYGSLGELYHAYDLIEAAEAAYLRALEVSPAEFEWLYLLGHLQQTEGRRGDSIETLERALMQKAGDTATLLRLASQALELNRLDIAERRYRQVLDLRPQSAAALQGLGRVATARGDHQAAIAAYEQALTQAPYANHLHFLLGMAYRRAGDLERAQRHLELQGPTEVTFDDPLVARMRSRATGSAVTQHYGFLADSAGFSDQALEAYRKAVAADPSNAEARRGLAGALQQKGDLDAALEQYRNLLRIDTNPAAAHFMYAGALQQKGDLDQALDHFESAVELEPSYRMFRYRLAEALAAAGESERARAEFERLIESDPRDVSARLRLGQLLFESGDGDQASKHFGEVLASDASPSLHAAAYDGKARVLARAGAEEAAIEAFAKALEIDGSRIDSRFALANLRGQAGEFSAAAADYRQVVEQAPELVPARLGEATALLLAGREAEARARLEEGARVLPKAPAIIDALARLLASAAEDDVRDGTRSLAMALGLYEVTRALEHGETVAMALAELGRFEEALDWQTNLLAEAERLQDAALVKRLEGNRDRYLRGVPARVR